VGWWLVKLAPPVEKSPAALTFTLVHRAGFLQRCFLKTILFIALICAAQPVLSVEQAAADTSNRGFAKHVENPSAGTDSVGLAVSPGGAA